MLHIYVCITANTCGSKLYIQPTIDRLLAVQQEPYKGPLLVRNMGEVSGEREKKKKKKNSDENGPLAETEQDRKSSRIIDKRTREETGMGNQMTALRFQTGERYQTTPVFRRGDTCRYLGSNPPPPSQCCELDHNTRRQKKEKGIGTNPSNFLRL